MDPMEPVLKGIVWLVAIVLLALIAFVPAALPHRVRLYALSLALFIVPFCWDAFAAA